MNLDLDEAISFAAVGLENANLENKNSFNGIKEEIEAAFRELQAAMFPSHVNPKNKSINENLSLAFERLNKIIEPDITIKLILKLPEIRRILFTDIIAGYRGDPAAKSYDEIILAYPAFTAISAYRIAHELYIMNVPLVPRIITEYAHRLTGIDIHPGATIGKHFFIDHGTGVVIGETSTIGERVKIYQNVTIGAKSFAAEPDGTLVKGIKRHPDIGNDVVIYAGATILGGDTVIGDNCVIGGNVWITHSVEAGNIVRV